MAQDMGSAEPGGTRQWFTVQCGYGSLNACTAVVEAISLEDACARAIEAANCREGWRPLDACGPTYIDAVAKGHDVDVWTHTGSKIEVPASFAEHGETMMLKAALSRLLKWADQVGGYDAPCWADARTLIDGLRALAS